MAPPIHTSLHPHIPLAIKRVQSNQVQSIAVLFALLTRCMQTSRAVQGWLTAGILPCDPLSIHKLMRKLKVCRLTASMTAREYISAACTMLKGISWRKRALDDSRDNLEHPQKHSCADTAVPRPCLPSQHHSIKTWPRYHDAYQ